MTAPVERRASVIGHGGTVHWDLDLQEQHTREDVQPKRECSANLNFMAPR
jgi:hypothetical protein